MYKNWWKRKLDIDKLTGCGALTIVVIIYVLAELFAGLIEEIM